MVVSRKQGVKQPALKHYTVRQAGLEGAVHGFFGRHHARLAVCAHHQRSAQGFFHQLFKRHHAADQPRALGLHCVHHAACQCHVHCFGFAHRTRQALGAARAGNHAQLDFRLAKFSVVSRNNKVAHHGQLTTAAQSKTTHCCDHWLANAFDLLPIAGDVVALVDIGKTVFGHRANVSPGCKGFFTASDDHATDVFIKLKGLQSVGQLVHELVIERVQLLWAIQRHDANAAGVWAFGGY